MRSHAHIFEREQVVERPLDQVFAFFADAANLEALTPSFLRFQIVTPLPIEMRAGALIEYKLHLFGVGLRWKTLIELFENQRRFVDVQLEGPYRSWRHEHDFTAVAEGTLVKDRVTYVLPFGPLGELARMVFVNRSLATIFEFRRQAIASRLNVRR